MGRGALFESGTASIAPSATSLHRSDWPFPRMVLRRMTPGCNLHRPPGVVQQECGDFRDPGIRSCSGIMRRRSTNLITFSMAMREQTRARSRFAPRWRIAVVLLAIVCLAASLATRFAVVGPEVQKETSAKSQTPDAQRQHLLASGLQWTTPASSFTLFQPPRTSVLAASVVVLATNLNSESWLYNRPPPSC